jgi:hypothetical protein
MDAQSFDITRRRIATALINFKNIEAESKRSEPRLNQHPFSGLTLIFHNMSYANPIQMLVASPSLAIVGLSEPGDR